MQLAAMIGRFTPVTRFRAAVALVCFATSPVATAVDLAAPADPTGLAPDGRPGAELFDTQRDWSVALGLGVAYGPEYEGASDRDTEAYPVLTARWRRFGFDSATLRYFLVESERATLTVGLGYDVGRDADVDGNRLRGMGEIESGGTAVATGGYSIGAVTLSANVTHLFNGSEGTRAELGASVPMPLGPRAALTFYVGTRWADANYAQAYFGVTPQQSAASGFAAYEAGSGFVAWGGMVHGFYALTPKWSAFGRVGAGRLMGDAKDSPTTARSTQVSGLAGFAYAF